MSCLHPNVQSMAPVSVFMTLEIKHAIIQSPWQVLCPVFHLEPT